MPALLPTILTASQIVLVADAVPKFNVEQTCRQAAQTSADLGRAPGDCQRDENDARGKLEQDWAGTIRRSARTAYGFPRSAAHPATSNC